MNEIDLQAIDLNLLQYWHQAVHQDPAHKWLRHLVHEVAKEL